MSKPAILLGCCALFCLALASTASADLLVYEPFDYSDVGTTVEGKTNPDGQTWVRAYTDAVNPPNVIKVASGNLSVPSPLLSPKGNSAEVDGSGNGAGKAIRLPFGSGNGIAVNSGGTVYYSFSLRADALTGSNTGGGGFFIGLNNSDTATTGNPTAAAARVQARINPNDPNLDNPTTYNLGIVRNRATTAADVPWSGPLTVGDTLFVVASIELTNGTQNDVARLWINPDPSTFGDASFSLLATPPTIVDDTFGVGTIGTDIGIASIILRQSPAPHVTLDELRVGTDWASVTPIPEPAAWALPAIGCVLMCFFAWKKSLKPLGT